ncbi:MAG: hypothetical protein CSA22_00165, partial [Deltaproteobacteria bacterium]
MRTLFVSVFVIVFSLLNPVTLSVVLAQDCPAGYVYENGQCINAGGWSEPAACRWVCGPGFRRIEDTCVPIPVAVYEFENNTADSSGNGYDGIGHGDLDYTSVSDGNAAVFNGPDTYIGVENSEHFNFDRFDRFCIFARIKRDKTRSEHNIVSRQQHAPATPEWKHQRGWRLYIDSNSKIGFIMVHSWTSRTDRNFISVKTTRRFAEKGRWYDIDLVYDGSGDASGIRMIVDGEDQPIRIVQNNLSDTIQSDAPLEIGSENNSSRMLAGAIDRLSISGLCGLSVCEGVDCEGRGTCVDYQGQAACACDANYTNDGDLSRCIHTKVTDCADAAPAHATSSVLPVEAVYTDENGWEIPACSWQCDEGYRREGDTCVRKGSWIYTYDADFDEGILDHTEHNTVHDQLALESGMNILPFIWVANSGEGTVSKINTLTGEELGRYRTGPSTGTNPSRTTVDARGDLWVGNRDTASATKINLYPYDKNGDGVIRTSTGPDDILPWGEDEAIALYVTQTDSGPRAVATDAENNVWIGGNGQHMGYYDGNTGEKLKTIPIGRPCYGALIDGNGTLWISNKTSGLTRIDDPSGNHTIHSFSTNGKWVYGLGIDPAGYIYTSGYTDNRLRKLDPQTNDWIYDVSISGGDQGRGVAVGADGDVWVAHTGTNRLTRHDGDTGALKATVMTQAGPTGVAVDSEGKIWTTCLYADSVQRIDPVTNAVAFTQDGHDYPYNYSDMTGYISRNITSRNGRWTVICDAEYTGAAWGLVSWNSREPSGTRIQVKVRSSEDQITWSAWVEAESGLLISDLPAGRYIEIETTFTIRSGETSPVLYDLTVSSPPAGFVNTAPVISSTPVTTGEEGTVFAYAVTAVDPEGTLTYSLDDAPYGMRIDSETGAVSWMPDAYQAGDHGVTVRVKDSAGAFTLQHFTISVSDRFDCNSGETRSCGSDVGTCASGTQVCVSGFWGDCEGAIGPQPEICDGLDNNCNGFPDDGLTPPDADHQCGVCSGAVKVCSGAGGWVEPDYTGLPGYEFPEVSRDGLDNDCDCTADEDPDLIPLSIDVSDLQTDLQHLSVSGTVVIEIFGTGGLPVDGTYTVLLFEDVNGNETYEPDTDRQLATSAVTNAPFAEEVIAVSVDITSPVLFRDNRIFAFIDNTNTIPESDETNNMFHSGPDCDETPSSCLDVSASFLRAVHSGNPDSETFFVRLGNSGDAVIPDQTPVAFYDGSPDEGGVLLGTAQTDSLLSPGEYTDLSFIFSSPSAGILTIVAVADDDGTGQGTLQETDETNNRVSRVFNIGNNPPVPDAGPDQTVRLGETVTLSAENSSDPEGDALSFFWELTEAPDGSTATVSDASS